LSTDEFDGLPLLTVLKVLKASGVEVATRDDGTTVLVKGTQNKSYAFPEMLQRRMLHSLARTFDVEIRYFFHPELVCGGKPN
jgi:hypothetical protein